MFFGGWRAPWPISYWHGANQGWYPMIWFLVKLMIFVFVFIWLRGTLPRLRYDQFMKLGWKVLIPVSLVWLLLVAVIRQLRNAGDMDQSHLVPICLAAGALFILVLVALEVRERNQGVRDRRAKAAADLAREEDLDGFGGGFPVPPLPGQARAAFTPRPLRRPSLALVANGHGSTEEETSDGQ
jgi:NADH-quinone oxidoreductase subunit H